MVHSTAQFLITPILLIQLAAGAHGAQPDADDRSSAEQCRQSAQAGLQLLSSML
jgi:hypothetical protein